MNYEVDIVELGKILKTFDSEYNLKVLFKTELSGGWITIDGNAGIEKCPEGNKSSCGNKKDNIIHIRLDNKEGSVIRITGLSNKKFKLNVAPSKYKEIRMNGINLNSIKESDSESKMRIDDNIIFTISDSAEKVNSIVNKVIGRD